MTDVAISPDGNFLYATGFDDDALVRFTRNPTTGALTNPSVTSHAAGVVDGLDGPRSVEISRDGRRLFVTGDVGSVIALYRRDPDNGVLKRIQAEVDGDRSGDALAGVRATAVSRDGRHLYARRRSTMRSSPSCRSRKRHCARVRRGDHGRIHSSDGSTRMMKQRIRGLAIAACLAATPAGAQGPPPFDIVPARSTQSAALHVNLTDPQAFQKTLDATGAANGENAQEGASDGGRVLIATSANDIDTFCDNGSNPQHNFAVLYWDSPFDSSDPGQDGADRTDFSQEMFYEVDGTGCASNPDAPLYAIASSSHNLGAGTIDVRAHAATQNYGYDSLAVGPITTNGYGHYAEAQATAGLSDWVYVTGPNPTATVTLVASFDANFDCVPMPLNDSDWFSEAFDEDIRLVAPCGGDYERPDFSGDAERPEGVESSELALNVSLRDNFVSQEICNDLAKEDLRSASRSGPARCMARASAATTP